jgi:ATP-dependent Clp protease ATP-binding subunit ClpA
MLIWTKSAREVLGEASAKADSLNHREVHPLHLLWVLAGRTGLEVLRQGGNDQDEAKLRFRVERDLGRLPNHSVPDDVPWSECATPGFKMQRLLLRAADLSSRKATDGGEGRIGEEELLRALLQDDPRTAVLLRARENMMQASA